MATCLAYEDVYGTIVTDEPSWSGAARSIIEFSGDCWFGFEVTNASVGVVVGLNTENLGEHYLEIDHALYFLRGTVRTLESGAISPGVGPIPYDEGDRFYIMRFGSEVAYLIRPVAVPADAWFVDSRFPGIQLPGGILYVSGQASNGTVFLDISMYAVGDRIVNEAAGEVWTTSELAEDGAALAMPFITAFAADFSTWAVLDMPFTISAGGSTSPGAALELPFTVLGADIPLESLIILELPFTISAEGSEGAGNNYPTLAGVTAYLPFSVEARGIQRSAGVTAELPFTATVFGSSGGIPLEAGALLNLPLNLFMTGSGGGFNPATRGASLSVPFDLLMTGSSPTDDVITAGAWLEVPFIAALTGTPDDDVSPESWVFGELPFTMTGFGRESAGNYFDIRLSFNAAVVIEPGPGEAIEIMEGVQISMSMVAKYVVMLRDFLNIVETPKTFTQQYVELWDTAAAVAEAIPQFSLFIQEVLNIDGTITIVQTVELADALVAAGLVQNLYQGVVAVTSAILASDNDITGGSAVGGTAGVSVQAFGPPSVEFTFTGYWAKGTEIQLGYTTDAGPGYISYTFEFAAQTGAVAMALFADALDAQALVNATYDGTSVTMTAQSPATTVQL